MSNEIDWSKAPKGADKIVENPTSYDLHWANDRGVLIVGEWMLCSSGYNVIATRPDEPERKTVEDAVEYYNLRWPSHEDEYIYFYHANGFVTHKLKFPDDAGCYCVCTRAEFEAEVERQKGEWTHTHGGQKCVVVADKPGYSWIRIRGSIGPGLIVPSDTVHPIPQKTPISKSEAYDRIVEWLENEDSQLSKELFWQKFQRINEVV